MRIICALLFLATLASCGSEEKDVKTEFEDRIDSLLSLMTLEEKAGQLTLYTSGWEITGPALGEDYIEEVKAGRAGNLFNAHTVDYTITLQKMAVEETRLGIPMLFGLDVIHGYTTTFPIPLAEACTWDLALIEETARLSAKEATSAGINWTFNPMVDIARDPRWGRVAEGSGEDAWLGGQIGAARVRGYQGSDLSDPETLIACVKHYAAYGAAIAGRDYNTVDMSDRVLRETYLPPFKAAIDAGVSTVMTAFNDVDGVPASGNAYLLKEILREEWGFDGFVVTDYGSINEMVAHGIVKNEKDAAALAFNAGISMDMQGGVYAKYIPELVQEGRISEVDLDNYVRTVLEMKFRLGLFEDPYRYQNKERESATKFSKELMDQSLQSGRESIVLLKNENNLLPISTEIKSLALIGPLADNQKDLLGTWHVAGIAEKVVTLLKGIENVAPNVKINYARGADFSGADKSGFREALRAAARSEVVVMAIGENYQQNGEAASRTDLNLPGLQQELLEEIYALGKPVVVVLMAGRPLTVEWMDDNIPAILNTWHLGTMAGQAIAETLFGLNNPSGKLPITFPRNVGQIPIYYNTKNTGRPFDENNKYTTKYIDSPNDPLYPFGYGLSYSQFKYGELKLSHSEISQDKVLEVTIKVTNTSDVEGEEIVQMYVQDLVGSVTRPIKELKGFKKVKLSPGETKSVSFEISREDLIFYTFEKKWEAEPGDFKVLIGANSVSTQEANFTLK